MRPTKREAQGRSLAEAALHFSQRVHEQYPEAVISPFEAPYTDEDLIIDVALPARYALREVRDHLVSAGRSLGGCHRAGGPRKLGGMRRSCRR